MPPIRRTWTQVGELTSLMIATAALATVTVIPALVLLGRDPKVMASAREPRDQVFNQSSSLA